MSTHTEDLKQRLADGELKTVVAEVVLLVPSHLPMEAVERNVESGVSFIIEEHQFFEVADNYGGGNVMDDITLLRVTSRDVHMKGTD